MPNRKRNRGQPGRSPQDRGQGRNQQNRGPQNRGKQNRGKQNRGQARQHLAEVQRQQRTRQLRIRALIGAGVLAVAGVIVAVTVAVSGGQASSGTGHASSGSGQAAGAGHPAGGATVDGISCQTSEQTVYHIHAHLAIFGNGSPRSVPAGIGIPGPRQVSNGFVEGGKCFYWLHTHDATGIIHIESPTRQVYTLGQFFDLWGQRLSGSQAGAAEGKVTVFVNGKRATGNPRAVRLLSHERIQIDVGTVTPPRPFTFPAGL